MAEELVALLLHVGYEAGGVGSSFHGLLGNCGYWGGCLSADRSTVRKFIKPGLFNCSLSTVARPTGDVPIICEKSLFHRKCSFQIFLRGLYNGILLNAKIKHHLFQRHPTQLCQSHHVFHPFSMRNLNTIGEG